MPELAREGVAVIVHRRDKPKTEDHAHDIVVEGGRAFAAVGALTDEGDVRRFVDAAYRSEP